MQDEKIRRPRVSKTVVAQHFPTVLMLREFEGSDALNRKLGQLMLRLETETINIASRTTNIGGLHSETNLFSRTEPELVALRGLVQQAVDDYVPKFVAANRLAAPSTGMKMRLWSWGINMRAGDINFQHVHPDSKISGVSGTRRWNGATCTSYSASDTYLLDLHHASM